VLIPCFGLFMLTLTGNPAQNPPSMEIIKVKIEAADLDRKLLLQKLNQHGIDHKMRFQLDDQDFAYRIVFETGQGKSQNLVFGSGGSFNSSEANASVYDAKGVELFAFKRGQRATDSGATNAVAKEIIKRILKLRALSK